MDAQRTKYDQAALARARNAASEIVARLLNGRETIAVLAASYGVSVSAITTIYRRHTTAEQRGEARRRKISATKTGKPGHPSWRKGKTGFPVPKSAWKKGELRGAVARKWRPVGTITVRSYPDGRKLRFIKLRDDGPMSGRWRVYARWLWEKHNGQVPADHYIVHADDDLLNDDRANLRCVPRSTALARANADPAVASLRARRAADARLQRSDMKREKAAILREQMPPVAVPEMKPEPAGAKAKAAARILAFVQELQNVA
jgi:hypothetical protein